MATFLDGGLTFNNNFYCAIIFNIANFLELLSLDKFNAFFYFYFNLYCFQDTLSKVEKNMLFLTCYEQKFIIFPYMKIQQMYLKYFHHTIKLAIIHLQMSHTLVLRICHANFHR